MSDDLRPDPVLSIVIPCWNQLRHTRSCVESILAHRPGSPFEVILVNNGSTDGTPEYFDALHRKDPETFRPVQLPANLGFAAGTNQGLKIARGHPLWLNNDTIVVQDGFFDCLLDTLHRQPSVGAVGPTSNWILGPQHANNNLKFDCYSRVHPARYLIGVCLLVRKEAFQKVGLIDEQFRSDGNDDLDYSIRLLQAGFDLAIDRRAFIWHQDSVTRKAAGIPYEMVEKQSRDLLKQKWGDQTVESLFYPIVHQGARILFTVLAWQPVDPGCYANQFGAFYEAIEAARQQDVEIMPMVIPRSETCRARNEACEKAMREDFTHVFFLDDDMLFSGNFAIQKLMSHNLPWVSGLCFLRTPPHYPSMFLDFGDTDGMVRYVADWPEGSLLQVDATGMACVLLQVPALKHVKEVVKRSEMPNRALFSVASARRGEKSVGEDMWLGKLFGEAGLPIHVDTSVEFGHLGMNVVFNRQVFHTFRDRARAAGQPFAGESMMGGYPPHVPGHPPDGLVVDRDMAPRIALPERPRLIVPSGV